ncbi:MAG: hypothetical protein JNL05_07170 [Flavobacteriales bacterium]|nr:hypothetical protein [Flavobacteriales bacterium]
MHHMHLLRLLPFLFVITLGRPVVAQKGAPADTSLARAMNAYLLATQRGDFAYVLEQVHPKLYTVIPKEAMLQAMEKTFNDPEVSMVIDTVMVQRIKGPVKEAGIVYHSISYENHMRMHSSPDQGPDGAPLDAAEQAERDQALLVMLQASMGKDQVRFDEGSRDYLIRSGNTMFAVKDPALGDWKFVGYKPEMEALMGMMVPEKVRKKLGVK